MEVREEHNTQDWKAAEYRKVDRLISQLTAELDGVQSQDVPKWGPKGMNSD